MNGFRTFTKHIKRYKFLGQTVLTNSSAMARSTGDTVWTSNSIKQLIDKLAKLGFTIFDGVVGTYEKGGKPFFVYTQSVGYLANFDGVYLYHKSNSDEFTPLYELADGIFLPLTPSLISEVLEVA